MESPSARATTHLANERTFLAWFRTGLTLIALGLAIAQFLTPSETGGVSIRAGLAALTELTGGALVLMGTYRYLRNRARIDADEFRPAGASVLWAASAALGATALGVVFVLFIRG